MSDFAARPPRLALWLLEWLLPPDEREFIIGDLEETLAAWVAAGKSRSAVYWGFWRAAFGALAACGRWHRRSYPGEVTRRRGDRPMVNLLRDARYGLRLLARRPAFAAVAVLTLALGIGANTAIFTVVNTLLLKPLPYVDAERIVFVNERNLQLGFPRFSASPPNFMDWRAQAQSFERLAAYSGRSYNFTGGETPERLRGLVGTQGFLEILGGSPVLGRAFRDDEFEAGKDLVVIINHWFWQRSFAGSPAVLNQTLVLNGQPHTIVGVMHPRWRFGGKDIAIFAPRAFSAEQLRQRGAHYLGALARLKPDVTAEQAQVEMTAIAGRLEQQYPDSNKNWGVVIIPARDAVVGDVRPVMMLLLGAVGFVLLIACANVANMQLARATVRAREMAIRTAIGAARSRLVQQLLTESLLLALAGGALGVAVAHWGLSSFVAAYPELLPLSSDIKIDRGVIVFSVGLSLLTAVLFGLAPALAASHGRLNEWLKEGGRAGGSGRTGRWTRSVLAVGQVAIALVLLAGAGLLMRSFASLTRVDPGFLTEQRVAVTTLLPSAKYKEAPATIAFYEGALQRIGSIPGVELAALTSIVPISGNDEMYSVQFEGHSPRPAGEELSALYYSVSPDYFRTMGIQVIKGRAFSDQDRITTQRVAIVNDEFARLYYPDRDPIGQRIRMGRNASIVREIVGVVGSVKHYTLRDKPKAQMYEPFLQTAPAGMSFVVKTAVDPGTIVSAVRREIQAVDAEQPIATSGTLSSMLASTMDLPRVQTMLLALFAGIALVLATVGLYGVMAFTVSERTQEIGIRMALGAARGSVLRMVIRRALLLTAVGLAIGLTGTVLLGRALSQMLEGLLFDVRPTDVATLAAVAVGLTVVALLASVIPAARAMRIDPVDALRSE